MWLALCEPHDEACLWAVAGLRRLGLAPIEVVLPDELVIDARLIHRIASDGRAVVELTTRRGLVIETPAVWGVLNRMGGAPAGAGERVRPADRDYVFDEVSAAIGSWLASLACPVLNRPSPPLLIGPWKSPARWRALAADVGLPTLPLHIGSLNGAETRIRAERRTVIVVGEDVAGAVPADLETGCRELARAAGAGILGISLACASGRWVVEDATPLPDLRHGGRDLLASLRRALEAS